MNEKRDQLDQVAGRGKIAAKLALMMGDVGYIKKDGVNSEQKYDFASDEAILAKVQSACAKHKVASFHTYEILTDINDKNAKGYSYNMVKLRCHLTVIDGDSGQEINAEGLGAGMDYGGDKAMNKAQTVSHKYAWMKLLNIPTGDDPEADPEVDRKAKEERQQGNQGQQRQQGGQTQQKGQNTQAPAGNQASKPTQQPQQPTQAPTQPKPQNAAQGNQGAAGTQQQGQQQKAAGQPSPTQVIAAWAQKSGCSTEEDFRFALIEVLQRDSLDGATRPELERIFAFFKGLVEEQMPFEFWKAQVETDNATLAASISNNDLPQFPGM